MQWFPGNGTTFGVVVAAIAVGGLVLIAVPSLPSVRGMAALVLAAFVGVASWVVLLRPRIGLLHRQQRGADVPSHLVLRGMVSSVAVPLVEVTSVDVRQTLVVEAAGRTWHSTTLGVSRRQLARGKRRPGDTDAGFVVGGPWGHSNAPGAVRPDGIAASEVVLARLERARQDAATHRLPGGPPVRTWAWVEIVGLVLTAVVSVVLLVV